jgi:outer membrane immunogenic protein
MRKTLLASVSAVVLSSSAVMAADLPVKARPLPPPPAPTWTGFYLGLNAGYAWGNSDPTLTGNVAAPPANALGIFPPSLKPRGFIGGGQAGYNWQSGQWVFGGEVDFSGLDAKADASISPFFATKGASKTVTWSSRYDWLFTARLRGGFLVAPNWLLYATGGLAVTHVNDSAVCTAPFSGCSGFPNPNTVTWSESSTLTGGTIGGGIETMFAPNWTARVEYLYAKFKDTTPPTTSTPPFPFNNVPPMFSFNHDLNIVRFAVNYKFGS